MRVNRKDKGSCRDAKGTVHTKNKNVAIIYSPSCGSTFVDFLLLIFFDELFLSIRRKSMGSKTKRHGTPLTLLNNFGPHWLSLYRWKDRNIFLNIFFCWFWPTWRVNKLWKFFGLLCWGLQKGCIYYNRGIRWIIGNVICTYNVINYYVSFTCLSLLKSSILT